MKGSSSQSPYILQSKTGSDIHGITDQFRFCLLCDDKLIII